MHEGFYICFCTDSTEIFSKLRSASLNYNLPSFFTDSYCAGGGGGGSNKHCLLTFFISILINGYSVFITIKVRSMQIRMLQLSKDKYFIFQ